MRSTESTQEGIGIALRELWTIHQVSEFLTIPVGTLYQWRHRGYGPPAWRVGRSLRYDASAVRRWLVEDVT